MNDIDSTQLDGSRKTITLKANNNNNSNVSNAYKPYDVQELKQKLDAWKVLLLPINNLLEWEHKFDPFVIVAANTFLFGMLMYYNPSILTTIAVSGLSLLLLESVVPLVTGYFFKRAEWDAISEMKYTRICERLSNFHKHFITFRLKLENIRRERQSLYFLIVFFFLIFCAYVGQMVDNLLLSYFTTLLLSLTPGARRHHLVEKIVRNVKVALGVGGPQASSSAAVAFGNNSNARMNPSSYQHQSSQQQASSMFATPKRASNLVSSSSSSMSSTASSSYFSNSNVYNDYMSKRK